MAELLYRIGRFAARHHWRVVGGSLTPALVVGLVTFLAFAGTISSAMSIPGTPTSRVTEQLSAEFDGTGGGIRQRRLRDVDGKPFTDTQREAVSSLLVKVGTIDGVSGVNDPFTTQARIDASTTRLSEGKEQLAQGEAAITEGLSQLKTSQAQLDEQRRQAEEAGALAQVQDQLTAGQARIDAGTKQLEAKRAELAAQSKALEAGSAVAGLSAGFRFVSEDGSAAIGAVTFAARRRRRCRPR